MKKKKTLFLLGSLVIAAIVLFAIFYPDFVERNKIKYYVEKTGMKQEDVIKNLANIEKWSDKIQEDDSNFDYYIELSRAYEYLGDIDKSIEVYESYPNEKQENDSFLYHNNLAKIYDKNNDYEEANKHYIEIIKNYDGLYPNSYVSLIENYITLNDKDNAWKYYIEYQKIGGEDIEILKKLESM